ncbi:MAG: hypothetical protein V4486_00995 [Patescibacteria group bacterium]
MKPTSTNERNTNSKDLNNVRPGNDTTERQQGGVETDTASAARRAEAAEDLGERQGDELDPDRARQSGDPNEVETRVEEPARTE